MHGIILTSYSDCQAAREEYRIDNNICADVYSQCQSLFKCDATILCSSECRDLYKRMQQCNSTDPLFMLQSSNIDLWCAISSKHNEFCISLFNNIDFSYTHLCTAELFDPTSRKCQDGCRNRLALHSDDCCINNQAIFANVWLNETTLTDGVWSKCNINSPGRCPPPSPVKNIVAPSTATTASSTLVPTLTPKVGNPEDGGGVSIARVDLFVFLLNILCALQYIIFHILV